MNFDAHQKNIIKAINDKSVYDILSFVKTFGYYEIYKNSKEELQAAFDRREKNRKYPVHVYKARDLFHKGEHVLKSTSSEMVTVNYFIINSKNARFEFDVYSEEGICIKTSFDEIKNFIAIWEYLKRELDVLEVKKDINKEEVGLFFERVPNEKYAPDKEQEFDTHLIPISEEDDNGEIHYKHKISAMEFIPEVLERNEEELLVCESYFDKKIIPTPALKNFIEEDFSTPDQVATRKSLYAAWVAIWISICATIFSVYATYNVDPSDANLKQIQEQLKSIEDQIDTANEFELEQILTEIQSIDISEYDDKDMKEAVENIEKSLDEIVGYIEGELKR